MGARFGYHKNSPVMTAKRNGLYNEFAWAAVTTLAHVLMQGTPVVRSWLFYVAPAEEFAFLESCSSGRRAELTGDVTSPFSEASASFDDQRA